MQGSENRNDPPPKNMREFANSGKRTIGDMLRGYRATQMLHVIAKLGIADHLTKKIRTAAELAMLVGADSQALYRLLRAVASMGILEEDLEGRFALTELGATLRSDVPDSSRNSAVMYGERWWWDAWGGLFDAVHNGKTAFDQAHGMDLFSFLSADAHAANLFNSSMQQMTGQEGEAIVSAFNFSSTRKLIDVGGGHGALAAAVLRRNQHVAVLLFDTPEVIGSAGTNLSALGIAHQCELVPGDFFISVPSGGDIYTLKDILHDWNDSRAGTILHNVRQAMSMTARLLIIERIITIGNSPSPAKLVDISMLVLTGGQERTEREYRTLLTKAGFSVQEIIAASGETSIIVAKPC